MPQLATGTPAVAIHATATTKQVGLDLNCTDGRSFLLWWCESSLAIREAQYELEQLATALSGTTGPTPVSQPASQPEFFAQDVAIRLARARAFQPDGWDIVRLISQTFQTSQTKATDTRLGPFAWIADAWIHAGTAQSSDGSAALAPHFLDPQTIWSEVLARFARVPVIRPDAQTLLIWSMQPDAMARLAWSMRPDADPRLRSLSTTVRRTILDWLSESAGAVAAMVLGCVQAGCTGDALALGLVSGVIFSAHSDGNSNSQGQSARHQAAIDLQRYVNGMYVGVKEGRNWAAAAEQVVCSLGADASQAVFNRADVLLHELQIGAFARFSTPPRPLSNEPPPAAKGGTHDWISGLLTSPIYTSQRQLAARVALPDDTMRVLLEALAERGGKLSRAALAHKLALAEVRMAGVLSAVRRVLNVDQAGVVIVDEVAGSVNLNIALLQQQFKLSKQGGRR